MMADTSGERPEVAPIQLALEPEFNVGQVRARPSLGEIELDGAVERLEPRVMQVLVVLARANGATVSRDALIASCWAGVVVGDNAIDQVIGKLRRLSERESGRFRIETLPRIGFRLVQTQDEPGTMATKLNATEVGLSPSRIEPPWSSRRSVLLIGGVTAGAAVLGGAFLAWPRAPASKPRLIAVLPFDGQGGADAARLADGVSHAVLSGLTRDGGMPVVAHHSSFQFRGEQKTGAAAALGASHVIDGSVSRNGDTLRVTAYLIDADRGLTLWSEQFDSPISEVFSVQDRIATRVAQTLDVQLSARRVSASIDPIAYDLYTRALLFLEQPAREPTEQALAYLEQVVMRAPRFAAGWAALAEAQRQRMLYLPVPQQAPERDASRRSAERALAIDPLLGQAYGTLANLMPRFGQWSEVERLFQRGLTATPQSPGILHLYAQFLMAVGRTAEALTRLQALRRLNPLSAAVAVDLANALFDAERQREALAVIQQAYALSPSILIVWSENVRLHAALGNYETAEALLNAPPSPGPQSANIAPRRLHLVAQRDRHPGQVASAIRYYEAYSETGIWPGMIGIRALSALGAGASAIAVADRLYRVDAPQASRPGVNFMKTYTLAGEADTTELFRADTAPIRRFPVFPMILTRIGLTEYWRTAGLIPDFCGQPGLGYSCRDALRS